MRYNEKESIGVASMVTAIVSGSISLILLGCTFLNGIGENIRYISVSFLTVCIVSLVVLLWTFIKSN